LGLEVVPFRTDPSLTAPTLALEIFETLLTDAPETAHEMLFPAAARAG